MAMKISACYIVRNEEKNLEKSLQSVHQFVDEIIIVDTGSTDNTKKIAQKYRSRIYDFSWQDDFSAPRNFALSKAAGDWIVFLDADEYFSPGTAGNLRTFIKKQHKAGKRGCLLVHRQDIDCDNGNEILADILVQRIFFKQDNYRYEGIIHEELLAAGAPLQEVTVVPPEVLLLIHTGYRESLSREKAERNLKLLSKELVQTDNPGRIYMFLADAYLGLGDKENAKRYAKLDVAQGRRATTYASRSYRILLQLSLEEGASPADRLALCRSAVRDFPECPEFRADLAECLAAAGDYQQAVQEMGRALQDFHAYRGIEPMLLTAEQAEMAQRRMHSWQAQLAPSTLAEIAENLRMLIYPLLLMTDEEYSQCEAKNFLPPGFAVLLARYHGGTAKATDNNSVEYLDLLDLLLDRKKDRELEKLLAFVGDFSQHVRQQAIERLDKKIKQVEAGEERI